jgi:hypothetical protein
MRGRLGEVLVPREEFILVDTYQKLFAGVPGVRWLATEGVADLFRGPALSRGIVVVSSSSDFGVTLQDAEHPNADLRKLASCGVDWEKLGRSREGYHSVGIGPACEPKSCAPSDRYSLKCDRYTWATFPDVPDWVGAWFTTNLNVAHPKVEWIPFGVSDQGGAENIPDFQGRRKDGPMLYVNFQDYTEERVLLKRHYGALAHTENLLVRQAADLPHREYLAEMTECPFVLCPPGNGLDCYRTYEVLYTGGVPVMKRSVFSEYLEAEGLPVLLVDDLFGLAADALEDAYDRMKDAVWDYEAVTRSCWEKTIKEYLKPEVEAT